MSTPPAPSAPTTDEPATHALLTPHTPHLPWGSHGRGRLAAALTLLLTLSAGGCAYLGWRQWDDAAATETPSGAAARDAAWSGTVDAVEALLSADYHEAGASLDRWTAVTTGRLHARLSSERSSLADELEHNKEVTTAEVVESGMTSWDETAGTARVLAVINLTTHAGRTEERTTVVRYLVMAQRIDSRWKLSAVQQIGDVA